MDDPIKPWKKCKVCGADAYARDSGEFMRHGKGWFDCIHGHGFYARGFNELPRTHDCGNGLDPNCPACNRPR